MATDPLSIANDFFRTVGGARRETTVTDNRDDKIHALCEPILRQYKVELAAGVVGIPIPPIAQFHSDLFELIDELLPEPDTEPKPDQPCLSGFSGEVRDPEMAMYLARKLFPDNTMKHELIARAKQMRTAQITCCGSDHDFLCPRYADE